MIYFSQLNFSATSTPNQKEILEAINRIAESRRSNVTVIPRLPIADFSVCRDNIHWTEGTANTIYSNWLNFLNLN
jgi:hypothetical protein